MSAYQVDDYHINALVSWAAGRHGHQAVSYYWNGSRRDIRTDPKRIASVLYAENVRSVNARYKQADDAHGFRYKSVITTHLKLQDIVMACRGLAYQSCETSDWEQTEARAILEGIKDSAVCQWIDDSNAWALVAPRVSLL
jgi:hypothetical protein